MFTLGLIFSFGNKKKMLVQYGRYFTHIIPIKIAYQNILRISTQKV